jgi:hypothetical protein
VNYNVHICHAALDHQEVYKQLQEIWLRWVPIDVESLMSSQINDSSSSQKGKQSGQVSVVTPLVFLET